MTRTNETSDTKTDRDTASDAIAAMLDDEQSFQAQLQELQLAGERAYAICRCVTELQGLFDRRWLQDIACQQLAVLHYGPAVDTGPAITVDDYLASRGLSRAEIERHRARFGSWLRAVFEARHGEAPPRELREVAGLVRGVDTYHPTLRPLLDRAWAVYSEVLAEGRQLPLAI